MAAQGEVKDTLLSVAPLAFELLENLVKYFQDYNKFVSGWKVIIN